MKSRQAHEGGGQGETQETLGLSDLVARQLAVYFSAHEEGLPSSGLYARMIREVERPLFVAALAACQDNQLKAAGLLGINRNTLRKKLLELGLAAPARSMRAVRASSSKTKLERGRGRRARGMENETKFTKDTKDTKDTKGTKGTKGTKHIKDVL